MSIPELIQFFNYKPIMDENPQYLLDEIKQKASSYLTVSDLEEIQDCYEFARQAHSGQIRQSGEYYISHILQATDFLMLIKPDLDTIKGCLLHDVIEDCNITAKEIEKEFGVTVRQLCEGVTKVSTLKYRGEERQIETIKKTFFAMSQDLRVIFIKLADRIHNIQTLGFHPNFEKQMRIVKETLEIYVPIAERLGLYQFQYLLENWCFHISNPKECDQIINYLNKPIYQKSAEKWIQILTKLLSQNELENFSVKWRMKSPWSVYKKLKEKKGSTDITNIWTINDLIAFRIIVDWVPSCYLAMWVIHNAYTPLIHKIKDYIVVPKPNGYQSIHSIILGLFPFPVEIQIRSFEMDKYAEYGVAAHFAYKEAWYDPKKSKNVRVDNKQSERVSKIQEIVKSYQDDNEWFKKEMKIELLDNTIFVYTPKWEIIEMKQDATVLDFAFRVHSEVGLRFKNAIVNWSIVPIDFQPKTGDIIQINTWKNQYTATRSWMDVLKTSGARNQLNKFLKVKIKDQLLIKSIENLNSKLAEYKLPLFKSPDCLIRKERESKPEERESKLLEMLDKGWYGSFINSFYKTHPKSAKTAYVEPTLTPHKWRIIIDGHIDFNYIECPECKWLDSQIIAKSGKEGIKIHHIGCKALQTIGYEKLISACYDDESQVIYHFALKLKINNQAGNLNKILQLLSNYNLNIKQITFIEPNEEYSIGDITLELSNPSKINFILRDFEKFSDFLEVIEKKFI